MIPQHVPHDVGCIHADARCAVHALDQRKCTAESVDDSVMLVQVHAECGRSINVVEVVVREALDRREAQARQLLAQLPRRFCGIPCHGTVACMIQKNLMSVFAVFFCVVK